MKLELSLRKAESLQKILAGVADEYKRKKLKIKEEFYTTGKGKDKLNKIDYDLNEIYQIINKLDKGRHNEEVARGLSKPVLR